MIIFKSINKLNKEVNFKANIGFVPTMGALHKGHISLINSSKKKCKKTLVSIFINPSQFNDKKDLKKYPKNLYNDIKILKKLKVDYLLLPKINEIYKNKKSMKVNIIKKDRVLCAKYRPGHFEGVLAVINQFLLNIKPKFMFLGEKDYQQIILIKKFIKKKFKTKIVECKTVRLNNLVPYSSRNFYLSRNAIKDASFVSISIYKLYLSIKKDFNKRFNISLVKNKIESKKIITDYFEIRNKTNLSKNFNKKNFKIFIAYYLNDVRLIDNF